MSPDTWKTWGFLFGNMGCPTTCCEHNCQPEVLLLIPFYLGLLPAAEYVPLLEAYFVMHLKGVIKSMAWASTLPSDIKGKISCLVSMIPSLEKEEGKPGWSLKEQAGWEATGTQERKKFKQNSTLSGSCLRCIGLCPRGSP